MSLKAIFFGFRGIILQDSSLRRDLLAALLRSENLPLQNFSQDYWEICLGYSDRAAIAALCQRRGYNVEGAILDGLVSRYTAAYLERLMGLERPPLYPGVTEAIGQLWAAGLMLGIATGTARAAVKFVLERARLHLAFETIVTGDDLDVAASKPNPASYERAIAALAERRPEIQPHAANCLAIENTYAGIAAARAAGLAVVGVANTHPLHMLQRRADWALDDLRQLDVERASRALA